MPKGTSRSKKSSRREDMQDWNKHLLLSNNRFNMYIIIVIKINDSHENMFLLLY